MNDAVVAAIRAGLTAIVPTDTVYGLVCDGYREAAVAHLYALKQRPESIPCALLAADLEMILAAVPELAGRGRSVLPARCCRAPSRSSCQTQRGASAGCAATVHSRSAFACRSFHRSRARCSTQSEWSPQPARICTVEGIRVASRTSPRSFGRTSVRSLISARCRERLRLCSMSRASRVC